MRNLSIAMLLAVIVLTGLVGCGDDDDPGGIFEADAPAGDVGGNPGGGDGDGNGDGKEPLVAVCHRPPGNPENAHTIWVGESAVPALLELGDTLGACPEDPTDPGDPSHLVEMCHIHGNLDHAHTIRVSEAAVPAHLAHGDLEGPCPSE